MSSAQVIGRRNSCPTICWASLLSCCGIRIFCRQILERQKGRTQHTHIIHGDPPIESEVFFFSVALGLFTLSEKPIDCVLIVIP